MTDIATLIVRAKAEGVAKVQGDLKNLGGQASKTAGSVLGLDKSISQTALNFAKVAGVATVGAAFSKATSAAIAFEKSLAEVSTLSNSLDMGQLEKDLISISEQFGADKTQQAQALYQVISAGAETAAEATTTLTVANKLAVGGVTDVAVAADGLTSALNAYGKDASEATDISDAMFTAMRAGKTTIGELSANIGKVAPIAAQAGVSFDELLAATAAVTKTGLNTSMTMNSLRQVMANVIKPTKEASEVAQLLGIEFNAAALESKGLSGFLSDIVEKTGGSTAAMSKLFGSVESLQSILFLASETGGKEFSNILEQMDEKAGATEEAFGKMSETAGFLTQVLGQQLNTKLLALGATLLEYLTPALVYVTTNFEELTETATLLGKLLVTGVLAKGLLSLPGLLLGVSKYLLGVTAQVTALSAALMANPFGLMAVGVAAAVSALVVFRNTNIELMGTTATVTDWISAAWTVLSSKIGISLERVGDAFGTFGATASSVFSELTAIAGSVWDALLSGAKSSVNTVIGLVDFLGKSVGITTGAMVTAFLNFGKAVEKIFKSTWSSIQSVLRGDFDFSELRETLEEELMTPAEDLVSAYGDAWVEIQGTDYVGTVVRNVKNVGKEIATLASAGTSLGEELEFVTVTAKRLPPILENTSNATSDTASAVDGLIANMSKSTEESGPWADALSDAASRIDSVFVDLWKSFGQGWEEARDSLIASFQQTLAEMAHEAVTRPIVASIVGSVTESISNSAVGSATSAIGDTIATQGLGAGIASAGSSLIAAAPYAAIAYGAFESYNDIASGKYGIGDTLSGDYFGIKYGDRINSAIPYGGDLFASGIQAIHGNPFGIFSDTPLFDNAILDSFNGLLTGQSNNRVYSNLTGGQFGESYFTDNGRHKEQIEAVEALTPILQRFSDIIGGTDLEGKVSASAKHGLEFSDVSGNFVLRTKDSEEFLNFMFEGMLDAASTLSSSLKNLFSGFDGTAEDLANYVAAMTSAVGPTNELTDNMLAMIESFTGTNEELSLFVLSMQGLTNAIKNNPVEEALADYATATNLAAMTMTQSYEAQVGRVAELMRNFSGSAAEADLLNTEFARMQGLAYQLTIALQEASQAISSLTTSSAQQIRESVMTEEELFRHRESQLGFLQSVLEQLTDPEQIVETFGMIERLNSQLFNSLPSEERTTETAERYASFIEELGANTVAVLGDQIGLLSEEMDTANMAAGEILKLTASDFQNIVTEFGSYTTNLNFAVDTLNRVVASLQEQGIDVNVGVDVYNSSAEVQQ